MTESRRKHYLDHNATTPMLPEAVAAMVDVYRSPNGNPGSPHSSGRRSRAILHEARATIASILDCSESEVVFCSGGTESINMLLGGIVGARRPGGHVITCSVEHPAVLESCRGLSESGVAVTILPVDSEGQ